MCGIAGYYTKVEDSSERTLIQMADSISHRGPDDSDCGWTNLPVLVWHIVAYQLLSYISGWTSTDVLLASGMSSLLTGKYITTNNYVSNLKKLIIPIIGVKT